MRETVSQSCLVGGRWRPGIGETLVSTNPSTGHVVWRGTAGLAPDVDEAVAAARAAASDWAQRPASERIASLATCAALLERDGDDLARAISLEVGKPRWEARAEVTAMRSKIDVTIRAWRERQQERIEPDDGGWAATRYRPHGVLAILGPFNLPGHIPHGQIVPALLAGNSVIFKPSEFAPLVGSWLADIWQRADVPAGVFNMVSGGGETGQLLASHAGVDGVLFTGSYATGVALARLLAPEPGKLLALELGGNNPLIVHRVRDVEAAVRLTILSAFLTAGQRCTCVRRLIVPDEPANRPFLERLVEAIGSIRVGFPEDDPGPFCGPVIHETAARRLLDAQEQLVVQGGTLLAPMETRRDRLTLLRPGLVDVTAVPCRTDDERFGPLLGLIRVADFDAAVDEANRTAYGLAAALVSDDRSLYTTFLRRVRAGVVNWNRPTTGASASLPFGGVGHSGNHRPPGFLTIDSCAYPVASLESERLMPPPMPPGYEA